MWLFFQTEFTHQLHYEYIVSISQYFKKYDLTW